MVDESGNGGLSMGLMAGCGGAALLAFAVGAVFLFTRAQTVRMSATSARSAAVTAKARLEAAGITEAATSPVGSERERVRFEGAEGWSAHLAIYDLPAAVEDQALPLDSLISALGNTWPEGATPKWEQLSNSRRPSGVEVTRFDLDSDVPDAASLAVFFVRDGNQRAALVLSGDPAGLEELELTLEDHIESVFE